MSRLHEKGRLEKPSASFPFTCLLVVIGTPRTPTAWPKAEIVCSLSLQVRENAVDCGFGQVNRWCGGSSPKFQPVVELLIAALGRTWTRSPACIGISHEGNRILAIIAPSPHSHVVIVVPGVPCSLYRDGLPRWRAATAYSVPWWCSHSVP